MSRSWILKDFCLEYSWSFALIASMKLLPFSARLGLLLAGVSYTAPTSSALDNNNATVSGSVNDALVTRAVLEKREVFYGCSDQQFSRYLSQAIQDARTIVSAAAIFHFHLIGYGYRYSDSD
jgi:hypothetical protein